MIFTPKPGIFKKTYSSEKASRDIRALLIGSLNNFIAGMNTDQPDLTLKTIDATAYFFQTLDDRINNIDPFIFYYEADVGTEPIGPETRKRYLYIISLVLTAGIESKEDQGFRLLRYRECLERLFEQAWNSVNKRLKLEIASYPPQLLSINKSDSHIGVGIGLIFDLT